jgi:hypothetical protein
VLRANHESTLNVTAQFQRLDEDVRPVTNGVSADKRTKKSQLSGLPWLSTDDIRDQDTF